MFSICSNLNNRNIIEIIEIKEIAEHKNEEKMFEKLKD